MTLFRKVLQPLMDNSPSRILTNFHIVSSALKHRPHYLFSHHVLRVLVVLLDFYAAYCKCAEKVIG